jgi:hypothetical protein
MGSPGLRGGCGRGVGPIRPMNDYTNTNITRRGAQPPSNLGPGDGTRLPTASRNHV